MSTIVLLLQHETWQERLAPLSFVGRMALTNYLTQTLVATTIFSDYGLGLYGHVGPAVGLLFTVGIYILQIPVSAWWMRRFRFGPMEPKKPSRASVIASSMVSPSSSASISGGNLLGIFIIGLAQVMI